MKSSAADQLIMETSAALAMSEFRATETTGSHHGTMEQ